MAYFKNPKKVTESIGLRKDSEQAMPGYMNFWVKDGVTLRPHFPFKPKLQISLLETIEKNEPVYSRDIFDIPFNFINSFTITTYPFPKASLSLIDKEFYHIEEFAFTALTVYNTIMEKISMGLIEDPFESVGFCQLRWGWEADPEPIMSNWFTLTLIGFEYNINATWLEIKLEMISGAQNFFTTRRLDKFAGPVTKKEIKGSKAKLHVLVEKVLKRFGLKNGEHYIIPSEQFGYEMDLQEFNDMTSQFRKKDTILDEFVRNALNLQLRDPALARKKLALESGFVSKDINNSKSANKIHKQIKKWSLVPRDFEDEKSNIKRVYYWKEHPTSIVQSIQSSLPRGYFLGYTDLRFKGLTMDDNGNISHAYIRTRNGSSPDITIKELKQVKSQTILAQKEFFKENKLADPELDLRMQQQLQAVADAEQEAKRYEKLGPEKTKSWKIYNNLVNNKIPAFVHLGVKFTKKENGKYEITAPNKEIEEQVTNYFNDLKRKIATEEKELKNKKAKAEENLKRQKEKLQSLYNDVIKENMCFKPINLKTGQDTEGLEHQELAERDAFIVKLLLDRIQQDAVIKINMSIMGDPWLDGSGGSHIDFMNDRVRLIVKRPDGKDTILTNNYFFMPEVTHSISPSGYTTSMVLMTDVKNTISKTAKGNK